MKMDIRRDRIFLVESLIFVSGIVSGVVSEKQGVSKSDGIS